MTGVDKGGIADANRAVIPVRAVKTLVANAINILILVSIADSKHGH